MGLFSFAESPQLQALLADISPPSIRDASFALYFTLAFGVGSLWTAVYGVIIGTVGEATGPADRVRPDGRHVPAAAARDGPDPRRPAGPGERRPRGDAWASRSVASRTRGSPVGVETDSATWDTRCDAEGPEADHPQPRPVLRRPRVGQERRPAAHRGHGAAVLLGSLVIWVVDHRDFPDYGTALWFSLQTVTTVGYGDVTPTTILGRLVAGVVMVTAIGFIAVFTAAVTSTFVEAARRRRGTADEAARQDADDRMQSASTRSRGASI